MSLRSRLRRILLGPPTPPSPYRGLDDLDRKLEAWLGRGGFFVEAGANDGVTQSNTFYYEAQRGWRGILIEPVPQLAERCRVNRPSATVLNCALGSFAQEGSQVAMTYCNLMSLVHGSMGEEAEARHVRIGLEVQKLDESFDLVVPCRALGNILDELGGPHIDFLSLDVEGYEENVLKGIDLPRQGPTYILVEARFEAPIRAHLGPYYDAVATLSHHDILFRLRDPHKARQA